MSGVSIGWFDATVFHPRPSELATAIRRHFRRRMPRALDVDVLRGAKGPAGAAYAMLAGAAPMQITSGGIDGAPNSNVTTFVLEVSGRPALLSAAYRDDTAGIWTGIAPPQAVQPLGVGMIELRAGMVVHADPTANWQGFTSLPWQGLERAPAPHAVMLQVGGYAAEDVETAAAHMALVINADMALSGSRL